MTSVETDCAAMAAALIDDELIWRVDRISRQTKHTPLDKAILREAELRGLIVRTPSGELVYPRAQSFPVMSKKDQQRHN